MPLRRSPAVRFQTDMPSYAEWERLSGGRQARTLPLLKFIDKKMYEHSTYARFMQQFDRFQSAILYKFSSSFIDYPPRFRN